MYQRIQKVASWNSPTQQISSQLSPRAKAQHNSPRPLTQEEKEKQAFGQDCDEASRLQLKEKIGGLTSLEQEKLSLLQAKMNNFWVQKRERASRFGHNIANISISSPHKRGSAPIQPKQASQPYRKDVKQQSLQQLSGSASKEGIGSVQKEFRAMPAPQGHPMPTLQAKLTIGEPGDKYEQEANSVAESVVNQINSPQFQQQVQAVQRQSEPEEESLQAKPEIKSLQRQAEPEEEEELQAKPSNDDLQRSPLRPEIQLEEIPEEKKEEELQTKSILQRREATAGEGASMDLESAINSARGSGQPLDAGLQMSMGQAMGADFSGVKVHTDAQSDQLNQSIQARAFTTGQDVFFRQGEYNPGSRGGQELIAHELTHVVQQTGKERKVQRKQIEGRFTSATNFRDITNTGTFATNHTTNGAEVTSLLKEIRTLILAKQTKPQKVIILSGCHGDTKGNLFQEGGFYWEDKDYNEGTGPMPTYAKDMRLKNRKTGWSEIDNGNVLIVLGWCYSAKSYNNWRNITADWRGF